MENKINRIINIESPKIKKLCLKKKDLVAKGKELNEKALDLAKQHEKLVAQIGKVAEDIRKVQLDIIPMVSEICKKDNLLTEFELPISTDIDGEQLVLKVEDHLEALKESFKGIDKFGENPKKKNKK